MTILLTGGTGKTSLLVAQLLKSTSLPTPFLLASRSPQKAPTGFPAVEFDWNDSTTFSAPFTKCPDIKAVYLIAPEGSNATKSMISFIDLALEHGVKRFVLLTGTSAKMGADASGVGMVWKHLDEKKVEYCVLRATWFMENLSQWQHLDSIKKEGKIYTACADGRVPFVSVGDIAAVAFRLLTDSNPPAATEYRVLGPELLTHDQIAAKLSHGLGKEIVHVKLTPEQVNERWLGIGMPEHVAKFMTNLEVLTAGGAEDGENDAVETITGKKPRSFDIWIQDNKGAWD